MQRATTHRRRRRIGTQRGGVLNDPAARKRGRNANNDNAPPGPPQPAAGPDSAFERALDASPLDISGAQLDALMDLLDAEVWRTHFSADLVVKIAKRNLRLMFTRGAEYRYDTPEQRAEVFKAFSMMALAPGPTGPPEYSHLDRLLAALADDGRIGGKGDQIGCDPVTGDTPLHVVVRNYPIWSLRSVLWRGDLWGENSQGQSPLDLALALPQQRKLAFLRECLDFHAWVNYEESFAMVLEALPAQERVELVNSRGVLIDIMRGVDKEESTITGVLQYVTPETLVNERALHVAAKHLECEWVVALLDRGANANETYANTVQLPLELFVLGGTDSDDPGDDPEDDWYDDRDEAMMNPRYTTPLQRLVASTSVEGVRRVLAAAPAELPAHVRAGLKERLQPGLTTSRLEKALPPRITAVEAEDIPELVTQDEENGLLASMEAGDIALSFARPDQSRPDDQQGRRRPDAVYENQIIVAYRRKGDVYEATDHLKYMLREGKNFFTNGPLVRANVRLRRVVRSEEAASSSGAGAGSSSGGGGAKRGGFSRRKRAARRHSRSVIRKRAARRLGKTRRR